MIWTCFQVPNGGLVTNLFLIYWNHAVVPGTNLLTWSKGNQFFLVRNFNPENAGNASRILKSFFFRPEFNSHCESNFWANTETTNPNFHELFDQSKEVWQAFFVYLFLTMFFGQKQSDWSKHCENSGFVVLELVVGSGERDKLHTYISWISRSGDNLEALVLRGRSRNTGNNWDQNQLCM